jgi:hypothetical protein
MEKTIILTIVGVALVVLCCKAAEAFQRSGADGCSCSQGARCSGACLCTQRRAGAARGEGLKVERTDA